MEQIVQLNSNAKLSDHFTLGEMTKSSSHPEVYNIPSHEAIANLKRVCGWLEVLREMYGKPIIINSGYRSPQLNKKIGGVPTSNHLTGCAVDIRVTGMEQLMSNRRSKPVSRRIFSTYLFFGAIGVNTRTLG